MNSKEFALLFGAIVFSGMIVQAQQLQLTTQESVAPSFSGLRSTESSGFRQVKFSGSLTNQLGQPLTGVTGITFAIYKDREGGAPLWIESQNVQLNSQGNYTALLGSTTGEGIPLDVLSSNEPRWLGVKFNIPDSEEQPRLLLVSVPYALKAADADTLGGKPLSAFVLHDSGSDKAGSDKAESASPRALTDTGTVAIVSGTTGRIGKFTSSSDIGDSVITESSNNIGIGTATPSALGLEIAKTDVDVGMLIRRSGSPATNAAILVDANGDLDFWNQNTNRKINFVTNNSIRNVIDKNGFVGVGTASPLAVLDVKSPGGDTVIMRMTQSNGGFGAVFYEQASHDTFMSIQNAGQSDVVKLNSNGNSYMNGGNIGIGTQTPTEKIDVVGGNVRTTGSLISAVATGTPPLVVNSTTQVPNLNASFLGGLSAAAARTRGIVYLGGCDSCSALVDTDDQKNIYFNVIGPMTIESVTCFSDAGTPSINIQKDDGTPANILSSTLICSPTGATSTSFVGGENVLALNDKLDFSMVTAGGTAKRVTVAIKATVN